jgi:hypothetical protein
MNFLIKIENGIPVNHPVSEENLRLFFSDLDINNPPEGWARFIRAPYPELSLGETIEKTTYELSNSLTVENGTKTYTDIHHIKPISDEELILMAMDAVKNFNQSMQIYSNAPYPAPDDGEFYVWSISSNSWVKKPSNFEEVVHKYYEKLKQFGLIDMSLEQIDNLEQDKKTQLQEIIDELY